MGILERDPFAPAPIPPPPPAPDPWVAVLAALDQLRAAIVDTPALPAPVVQVEPPDLGEIVMAVQALKGPATADDIAAAVARQLQPEREHSVNEAVADIADALRTLDFRLQGLARPAFGGGSVTLAQQTIDTLLAGMGGGSSGGLTDTELRASAVPVTVSEPTVTPVVATIVASGDTTVYAPAAGNAIRLRWVSALNDPDQSTSPLIKMSLGATELYRTFAIAHRQTFTGAANAALVVNLSEAASVAFTAHIEEFTP